MKKEADELLADVLAADVTWRAGTLDRGLAEMKRVRRARRRARVTAIVAGPLALVAGLLLFRESPKSVRRPPSPVVKAETVIPGTSIRVLDDDELLALFKGRPVALVGPADRQRLLLLDEAAN
jgi:hypothetical protein